MRYSLEPPRKGKVLHFTFNEPEPAVVYDRGPYGHDGNVVGDPKEVDGKVGQALAFDGNDDGVQVQSTDALDLGGSRHFTLSAWFRIDRETGSYQDIIHVGRDESILYWEGGGLHGYFEDGTDSYTVETEVSADGSWHHAAVTYDGEDDEELLLYLDGRQVEKLTETASVQDNSGETGIGYQGHNDNRFLAGAIDDARVYTETLSPEHVKALYEMGDGYPMEREVGEAWGQRAMPLIEGEMNYRFANALAENAAYYMRELDALLQARHIDDAAGLELDMLGQLGGIRRKSDERDAKYRARIKANLAAARSRGTFRDIVLTASKIVGIEPEELVVDRNDAAIATAEIYIPKPALDDIGLTTNELTDILEQLVAAGHAVDIFSVGETPFELTDDDTPNEPEKGLTSDDITEGGGLIEDV